MRKLLLPTVTLLMVSAIAFHVQSQQPKSTQTFASFWTQFKAAVAKNDKEAVATMTKFPFPFSDRELTKAEFIKKYHLIFDRKTQRCIAREKPVNDYLAHLDALKRTKNLPAEQRPQPQENTGSYSMFCGDGIYLFEIVNGKYKFTDIGVND